MIKRQYLLRPSPSSTMTAEGLAGRVFGELSPRWLKLRPAALTVTLTVEAPPRVSVIPFKREPVALVSVWERLLEERSAEWDAEVEASGPDLVPAGYLVQESVPVDSDRGPARGRRTPGVGLLTLLRRKRGLDDDLFLRRGHEGHTPLSLKLHPLWRYVRNVVERPVLADSPPLDGIVEEHFRSAKDLLDPISFFGGPFRPEGGRLGKVARMVPNMVRTAVDIQGFLDLASLESFLVEEYRFV